jgi:hypothetical protein
MGNIEKRKEYIREIENKKYFVFFKFIDLKIAFLYFISSYFIFFHVITLNIKIIITNLISDFSFVSKLFFLSFSKLNIF